MRDGLRIGDINLIGVASPGNIKENCIYHIVNLGIEKLDIVSLIQKHFSCPVKVKNDAKCAGIAEMKYGSMKEYQDGIFLCMGTGIGGAAFIDGKLLEPKTNTGMEFGHMVIEKGGNLCKCGNCGCFETYCSMKALKTRVMREFQLDPEISGSNIVSFINQNKEEEKMKIILEEYISYLAVGIANLVNIFEPQVISLGGSLIYLGREFIQKVNHKIQNENLLFNPREDINMTLAILGNDAGIIGAANI